VNPPLPFDLHARDALAGLRVLAEQAARAGGVVARRYFRTALHVQLKADLTEVSEADHAAQAAVVATIRAARPDDGFLTEETLDPQPACLRASFALPPRSASAPCLTSSITWIIDPIDGTRNFVRDIPLYVCSVGAMLGGYPLVGAIYDPERDTTYSAGAAEGLFVNGQPQSSRLSGGARPAGLGPRLVVALPSAPTGPITALAHTWLGRFINRNLGSTALHLALVADGQLDGMLSDNAKLWDLAAGWVLVHAMGGRMTTPNGGDLFPLDVATYTAGDLPFIAGRAEIFDQLLAS
jgi:myo-inositol-1(or 4)-monophosphatase